MYPDDAWGVGGKLHISTLIEGDYFGELALINKIRRTLSIRCSSDKVKLLSLDRDTFNRILGQIEQYLQRDYSDIMNSHSFHSLQSWTEEEQKRDGPHSNAENKNVSELLEQEYARHSLLHNAWSIQTNSIFNDTGE